jgi:hypothetical protein
VDKKMKIRINKRLLIFGILFSVALFVIGSSSALQAEENDYIVGFLRNMTFNPSFIQLDNGNYEWKMDETVFEDAEGKKLTPKQFLKDHHDHTVELVINADNVVTIIHPVQY